MICNNCGNTLELFNRFCPKCGAPAPPQYQAPSPGPSPYLPPQSPMMGGPMAQPKKSGCGKVILILAIILLVVGGGIAVAIYFGYHKLESTLKSSEAYTVAINRLKENEEVKNQLGEIKDTGFPLGAYNQRSDGSGDASFVMSVQGTKDSGRYEVSLVRRNSVWRLTKGVVHTSSGKTIDVADNYESTGDQSNSNSNTNTGVDNTRNLPPGKTISGGVLNGKAISLPKPVYPLIAKQARASGTVVVQVVIDEEGNVVSASPVSGHPLLRAAAAAAAREAKFAPTKLSGKPVRVSGVITYNFILE